jgi:hypothetical protein
MDKMTFRLLGEAGVKIRQYQGIIDQKTWETIEIAKSLSVDNLSI